MLGGLGVLLAGLWWVQVVSARDYQANLETQSFRTVRIPAVRGKILDRNGDGAGGEPAHLQRESVSGGIAQSLRARLTRRKPCRARAELKQKQNDLEKKLNRKLTKEERKQFIFTAEATGRCCGKRPATRSPATWSAQVSQRLRQPLSLNPTNFERHYETRLALPCPVLTNLNPAQIALFEEQSTSPMGVDLEVQSTRCYPCETTAAHVLGHLRRDDDSKEGEEAFFSFRLPDYRGVVGIEYGYDKELRGTAGAKSVLVNNAGYRQTENVWSPAEPGANVVLTIDLRLQQAAERALQGANRPGHARRGRGHGRAHRRHPGDGLVADASTRTRSFRSLSRAESERITELHAEKNRATQENYMPGSIFKTGGGHGRAGSRLESGGNHPRRAQSRPARQGLYSGRQSHLHDLAAPGDYDFRRALKLSSNSYFITVGLRIGPEPIIRLGQRAAFGRARRGCPPARMSPARSPACGASAPAGPTATPATSASAQDPVWVTPLQIAVLTAAIANGGEVLWPRLVDRIEPPGPDVRRAADGLPARPGAGSAWA